MSFRFRSSGWRTSAEVLALALAILAGGAVGPHADSSIVTLRDARILSPLETGDGTVAVVDLNPDVLRELSASPLTAEEWQQAFGVYVVVEDAADADTPQMLGTYEVRADRVAFSPRFSFAPGKAYRAFFECDALSRLTNVEACLGTPNQTGTGSRGTIEASFVVPTGNIEPVASVERVYPATDAVPENLLKFYVYFSHAMRERDVYRHVRLVDDQGNPVANGFVETVPELWTADGRRLTLICHPGRIKRGLELSDRMGLPLQAGRRYRLVIDPGLRDAYGRPLVGGFEKSFTVVDADRTSPSYEDWRIDSPPAGTREAVRVSFDEPLDHELLRRMMTVVSLSGNEVAGRVDISEDGTSWMYTPDVPWQAGEFAVAVHPKLEDLAGNRLDRLFDRASDPAAEAAAAPAAAEIIHLPFVATDSRSE